MNDNDKHSGRPARRPYDPNQDNNETWGRPTLLTRFSSLGLRGRLFWFGSVLTGANVVSLLFGFIWWKMLAVGLAVLLVAILLPKSLDN